MYTNTAVAYKMSLESAAKNKTILDKVEEKQKEMAEKRAALCPQSVIAPRTLKCTLGFREASRLMQISLDTGAKIRLTVGKKYASAESMLSLLALGLKEGASVVLTVRGGDMKNAFEQSVDVLDGKVFG